MKVDAHALLVRSARLVGPWTYALVSRIIAAGYFLFSPRVRESRRLYATLFPQRSRWYHLWCTFRQYQNFTTIHYDRLLHDLGTATTSTSSGGEGLAANLGRTGAVLLMSHLGNWEMAARLLMEEQRQVPLLLYMGVKEKEGVERTQKEVLRRTGVTIIGVDRQNPVPFAAVEGIRVLRAGGLVSMTGDIIWRRDQRSLGVTFLGHRAYVPEAPFVFALVAGVPIYVFFAFRIGVNSYQCHFSEPIEVKATSRKGRNQAIAQAAQRYADLLEATLRAHPLEWYHFDRFLHDPGSRDC